MSRKDSKCADSKNSSKCKDKHDCKKCYCKKSCCKLCWCKKDCCKEDHHCDDCRACNHEKPSEKNLISDQICGNINSECGADQTILWQSLTCGVFGSVSVFYSGGCESMTVFINDQFTFTLNRGQTKSVTVPDLRKLSIHCLSGCGSCTGKFCIDLHYKEPKPHPLHGDDVHDLIEQLSSILNSKC